MYLGQFLVMTGVLAALVSTSPVPGDSTPDPTESELSKPSAGVLKRRSTYNCNQDDRLKKIEAQAWADAGAMAEEVAKWDNVKGNEIQPLAEQWMGWDATKSENFYKIQS